MRGLAAWFWDPVALEEGILEAVLFFPTIFSSDRKKVGPLYHLRRKAVKTIL
jgi:hypothetical protein